MEQILNVKTGSVNTKNIEEYNKLTKRLSFQRNRLNCVTGNSFNSEYFILGNYSISCSSENKDYLMFRQNDKQIQQEVVDFLTVKMIEQINETITSINKLIEG